MAESSGACFSTNSFARTRKRSGLARPQEPHDLIDTLRGGINSKPNGNAIAPYENSCLSICLHPINRHALPAPRDSGNERCHFLATSNWDSRCSHKSTAIRVRDNILCEEAFQSGHVSLLRGSNKCLQKAPLLGQADRCALAIGDVFTSAANELADVCFLRLQDGRDLVVGVIERLAQNICGAFCGREFLKKQQNRKFKCFAALRTYSGIAACVHRFGKPNPDVSFAARVCGLDKVDTQSCGCRRQICGRVHYRVAICGLPPHPNVLHNILGLRCTSEHAVSNSEETRTHAYECRETAIVCSDLGVNGKRQDRPRDLFRGRHSYSPVIGFAIVLIRCRISRASFRDSFKHHYSL